MAKRKMKIHFRLPPYGGSRLQWRKLIHKRALKAKGVSYGPDDKLCVKVVLYLSAGQMRFHDVDNRLKDILDALQGRMGGSKKKLVSPALIPNDSQIYKALIEKLLPPKQSLGSGHVTISKY